jgi:hypothetical protein
LRRKHVVSLAGAGVKIGVGENEPALVEESRTA